MVQFLGAVTKQPPYMIITEYMGCGSMADILRVGAWQAPCGVGERDLFAAWLVPCRADITFGCWGGLTV